MTGAPVFLDTGFVQALLNRNDQLHPRALAGNSQLKGAARVVTTEAVLVEIGNALSKRLDHRRLAVDFIAGCYSAANMTVVNVTTDLLRRSLSLYEQRSDKTWGMTDCISIVVMRDMQINEVFAFDQDFEQAGFTLLPS
jgi:predicted nucleic acid-binding protein